MSSTTHSTEHREGPNLARDPRTADTDTERLEAALRSLPRATASPGFTSRLMTRVTSAGKPDRSTAASSPWVWAGAVAAAVLLIALVPRLLDRSREHAPAAGSLEAAAEVGAPLDAKELAELRARRDELEEELRALRRLAEELPPVVGVEGPSADYLIDLGDLAPGAFPNAGAVPVSYRARPR